MQEQAAPPRFRGAYPHRFAIPTSLLPSDRFFNREIENYKNKGLLTSKDGVLTGNFPKLILNVKDPEILDLAGNNLEKFDSIDCKDITCTCNDKPRFLQLLSHTEADRDAIVYNNCKRTIFAAAKRQMKSAPVPNLADLHDFLDFAFKKIEELIGDDLDSFGYSYNQWYNHLTAAKQKRMDPWHEFFNGKDPMKEHFTSLSNLDPKWFHYEGICKVEIQATDGKPRMVCSIPDLIKYTMGPITWKLEELFTNKIPTYCGGMNLEQMQDKINHYIDDGFCVVAEGDGSAFDNTQDVLLKAIDRYVYNWILNKVHHVPQEVFEYIANSFYKTMDIVHIDGKKKTNLMTYSILGTVFSGDCDTTLMNTLRMGLYNWYTCHKAGLTLNEDFVCFSKGDDFTVMFRETVDFAKVKDTYDLYWLKKPKFDGPIYEGLDDRIYGLGQILKFIEFGPPNTIKFCSLRAWYTNLHTQHIYLTRNPDKFTTLAKYSRKALHLGDAKLAEYLRDQALALIISYPGIHYFQDMATAYVQASKQYDVLETYNKTGFSRKGFKDKRVTLPLEVEEKYDGFSYSPRATSIRIVGSYWQTMKSITKFNGSKLMDEERRLVNDQIDSEYADRQLYIFGAGRP